MRALLATMVLLGVFSASALAQTVVGSSHDLSDDFTTPDNQVCIYCHAPHNALVAVPLWNHASTAQTFTMYSSSTLDNTIAGQPSSISKQCLSCHDGVTNIDAYGGGAGSQNMGTTFPGSGAIMGTNLGNDHPISINYDNTADPGLNAPSGAAVGTLPLFGAGPTYTVECGTCHNTHDQATYGNFLRASNNASSLCLTCHNK